VEAEQGVHADEGKKRLLVVKIALRQGVCLLALAHRL
jgi:hypothetical protein